MIKKIEFKVHCVYPYSSDLYYSRTVGLQICHSMRILYILLFVVFVLELLFLHQNEAHFVIVIGNSTVDRRLLDTKQTQRDSTLQGMFIVISSISFVSYLLKSQEM